MIKQEDIISTHSRCIAIFYPYTDREVVPDREETVTKKITSASSTSTDNYSVQNNTWWESAIDTESSWWEKSIPNLQKTTKEITKTSTKTVTQTVTKENLDAMKSKKLVVSDSLIGCTTSRDKGLPSSKIQLILKPNLNYYNVLKPGDWFFVYLDDVKNINIKEKKGLKFFGQVDRIAKNKTTLENGIVSMTYNVHGTGFGKVFEKTEIYFNPFMIEDLQKATLVLKGFEISGSPKNFIEEYLNIFLGDAKKSGLEEILFAMLIPEKVYADYKGDGREKGSEVCFLDILEIDIKDDTDEGFVFARDINSIMGGNLWNVLQQASNDTINELFTDLRDGKPTLIYRKIPLKKDKIISLMNETINDEKYKIYEKYIINDNIGLSDHELFDFIVLLINGGLAEGELYAQAAIYPQKYPQVDKNYIKRYGLRKLERHTEYGFDSSGAPDNSLLTKWTEELGEFWRNYWRLENGTIEIIGKTDFEIGKFYQIPEREKAFMVQGIQHSWEFGKTVITTLTVTHGLKTNGSYVDANASPRLEKEASEEAKPAGVFGIGL